MWEPDSDCLNKAVKEGGQSWSLLSLRTLPLLGAPFSPSLPSWPCSSCPCGPRCDRAPSSTCPEPSLYTSSFFFFFFIIHTTVERTNLMSAFPSGHKGRAHVRLSPRSEHVAGPPGSAIDLLYAQGALRWSTVYAPVHRALRTEKSETGKPNYFQRSQWFNGEWGETDHGQTGVKSLSGGWDMETLSGHAARTRRSLSCPCRVGPS